MKRQALADFITEFTYSNIVEVTGTSNSTKAAKAARIREKEDSVSIEGNAEQWNLYVDAASNDIGSGAGMMLISPEGHKIHCAIRFGFKVSNNKAKYEALIACLHFVRKLQAHNVMIFSDS